MFSLFYSRKAQGLSLKVIILAVLAIVVLVILIMMLTGKTKLFSKTSTECASRGGTCMSESKCDNNYIMYSGTDCNENNKEYCCVKVSG